MVLPKVRHLMGEGGKALLVRPALEVRRVQRDFVGDLRTILRPEPAAREIAIGFVLALQGHEAGRQLAAEKPVIEEIERPIQRGIGLRGRIGGLFCIVRNNNRTIRAYMQACLHDFILSAALAPCSLSKAHKKATAGASVADFALRVPLAGPPIRGPAPPQGCESSPNSGDRLCFHIENRIRGGFSLFIGLTFHQVPCHAHKGLA